MGEEPVATRASVDTPTPTFSVVLRGYDRRQVDSYVAEAERKLAEAVEQAEAVAALRAKLETERRELLRLRKEAKAEREDWQPSFAALGARAERILLLAQEEAESLRDSTERQCAQQRERTQRECLDLRHRAQAVATAEEQKAAAVLAAARDEAERIRADLKREIAGRRSATGRAVSESSDGSEPEVGRKVLTLPHPRDEVVIDLEAGRKHNAASRRKVGSAKDVRTGS